MLSKISDENELISIYVYCTLLANTKLNLSELEAAVYKIIKFAYDLDDKKQVEAKLEKYKNDFSKMSVEEFLFNLNMQARRGMSDYWTKAVSKTFFDKKQNKKRIFIPYAQSFPCLFNQIKSDVDNTYVLQVPNKDLVLLLKEGIFKECSHVNVIETEVFDKSFNDSFDYIFTMPPLVGRLSRKEYLTGDITGISFEVLANSLNKDGVMTIIIPARIILSGDKAVELREFIEKEFNILEVSELPPDRFTSIKLFAVTIKNAKTNRNNTTLKEYTFADDKNSKLAVDRILTVAQTALEKANVWTPTYFLDQEGLSAYNGSDIAKVRLSEHFEIYRGRTYQTVDPKYIPVKLLNVKDINFDNIEIEKCEDFQIDIKTSRELYLQKNDIVLPCRGNGVMKIGIISSIENDCVPSQNIVVIRAKDGVVNPEYLKIFFESPIGLKLINSIQRGDTIKQLSHKDIAQLDIPAPDRQTQDLIVQEFKKGKKEYEEVTTQALNKWNDLKTNLYNKFC